MKLIETLAPVGGNHGVSLRNPKRLPAFLAELIQWGINAPEIIFAPNDVVPDIYTFIKPLLGPWESVGHRRAVMLEVLRVLAGFESSWNFDEGRDLSANNKSPETEETGAFQVSANSMSFDPSLKSLVMKRLGTTSPRSFIVGMKSDHDLAIEYAARLLRFTVRHNGPVSRKEINNFVSRKAVREFMELMKAK